MTFDQCFGYSLEGKVETAGGLVPVRIGARIVVGQLTA